MRIYVPFRKDGIFMSNTKKVLAVVLAVIMAVSCFALSASAVKASYIPSIVVPGVFQSEVFCYDENGNIECNSDGEPLEKPFFLPSTMDIVGKAITEALSPLALLLANQEDKDEQAANAVANVLADVLMDKQQLDSEGHFVNDIRATKYDVSYAELSEHDREYIMNELPLQKFVDIAGEENLFVFSYASFGNMHDTAYELYEFIAHVKEITGAPKVNIVPISQGGSVAVALLQIYADEGRSVAEDIHKILYIVPALDGAMVLGEVYEFGLIDDDEELYKKMLPALMGSDEWSAYLINLVLRIFPNADLNNILDKAVDVLISKYIGYSTLMWGLVPSGNYINENGGAREKYLMGEEFDAIREQTDWFYDAQIHRFDNIQKAIDDGVQVFDIVDYNVNMYEIVDSWDDVNADGIIHTDSESMGAYSKGVNIELPADYVCKNNHCTCGNPASHADPNNIVDACAGLLPEQTFYFFNQNHEKTASNNIIMFLAADILTDDDFTSVHSYPDKYPQFNVERNSKGFMRDIAKMKAYDTSDLSPELQKELADAIDAADAAINNTNMAPEDFEKAKQDFNLACAKVMNGGKVPEVKADSSFDFNNILVKIFKFISDLFFWLFRGDSIGEIIGWEYLEF